MRGRFHIGPRGAWAGLLVLLGLTLAFLVATPMALAAPPSPVLIEARAQGQLIGARLELSGPSKYRQSITRKKLLRLKPGRYVLTPKPLTTPRGTWYPAGPRTVFRVAKRRTRQRQVVDYTALVSPQAKVLSKKAMAGVVLKGSGVVLMPWSTAKGASLRRGSIIVADRAPGAPDGLLRRVVTIKRVGDRAEVATEPAALSDAAPVADFTFEIQRDGTLHGEGVQLPASRKLSNAVVVSTQQDFQWNFSANKGYSSGPCELNVSADSGLGASVWAGAKVDWDWGWLGPNQVGAEAYTGGSLIVRYNLQGTASCKIDSLSPYLLLGNATFLLGPLPVTVNLKLALRTALSVAASGALGGEYQVATEARGGVLWVKDQPLQVVNSSMPPGVTDSFSFLAGTARADFKLGPQVYLEFYGTFGPTGSLLGTASAVMDSTATPWWYVDAGLDFEFGGKLQIPGIADESFAKTWNIKTWRLAQAEGAKPPPPGLAQDVLGPGVSVTNLTLTGGPTQAQRVTGLVPGQATWVLSSGNASDAVGSDEVVASTPLGLPGDARLSELVSPEPTYDATTFKARVTPTGSTLHVRYVFASEEYPEWVGAGYDDVMGVFVNGVNCALVPNTATRVSVDSINAGSNSQYFVNNSGGASGYNTTMDGLTKPLQCDVPVSPGVPVDVEIGVADVGDEILDSAVALLDKGIWSD